MPQPTATIPGFSNCNRWNKGQHPACDRIQTGIVIPEWQPSFQIAPDATVFAIGSCFARNIEMELSRLGVNVTSREPNSAVMEIRTNHQLGLLNQYNPVSIQQELEWAAGISTFPDAGLLSFEDQYIDLFTRANSPRGSREALTDRRRALQKYFARAFDADLVIVTLGLAEIWFDRHLKLALTDPPSPRLQKQYPERFGFKQLFFPECFALVRSISALLRKYGKNNLNIIFTVSPVALQRTFSRQDIIVANMQSKSTLRAAVGELVAQGQGIDYFPSYEAALLSDPLIVWQPDRRNVTDFIVAHIMREFTSRYGLLPQLNQASIVATEQFALKARLGMAQQNIAQLNQALDPKYSPLPQKQNT